MHSTTSYNSSTLSQPCLPHQQGSWGQARAKTGRKKETKKEYAHGRGLRKLVGCVAWHGPTLRTGGGRDCGNANTTKDGKGGQASPAC